MHPGYILIHHSLTEDSGAVSWDAIRKYHMEVNGWKDVGYHYGIELVGDEYEIFKGRMDNEVGAHCIGFNGKSIGICLVGNFDKTPPPADQLALLRKICRSLMGIYGIKADHVLGHRETFPLRGVPVEKTCPGSAFDMNALRRSL
jgi:N-acetyl-anhydromuramyl-L-alanine amidase AmpD